MSISEFVADLSIPLRFNGPQPNAFGVDAAVARQLGDTCEGSSVNFDSITLTPHCNGTHTECVGHITDERISVRDCLVDVFMDARLVSVEPEERDGDLVITQRSLDPMLGGETFPARARSASLIVRTLPNEGSKLSRRYGLDAIPPYFLPEAMELIVGRGFRHLLVDLPSIDRLDDPELPCHRIFWNVKHGSREIGPGTRVNSTISELLYIPNEVPDGDYGLNLQIAPFESDCSPSRPLLLRETSL